MIAEASQISPQGKGYPATPGIHSAAQVAGWRAVTDAVKARGATIFLQLWHVGRISHPSHQPGGERPVAPSPVRPAGETLAADWRRLPYETPRALSLDEITAIVADYRRAALNARDAGFDGVELHGANGYLLDQFLQDGTNHRTDAYGGDAAGRARLLLEVLDAVAEVWGMERIGVRLSPFGTVGDIADSDPQRLFAFVIDALSRRQIGYLHLIEPRARAGLREEADASAPAIVAPFRALFAGPLIASGGFDRASAAATVAAGAADAIAFGRAFIANPDLPRRLKTGAPLNPYDRATFYGGSERGYTDYPALAASGAI
jgi:N-ethylmaleimide reductase